MPSVISDYINRIGSHPLQCLLMFRLKGQGMVLSLGSSLMSPLRPYVTTTWLNKVSLFLIFFFKFIYYTGILQNNSIQNCWQKQKDCFLCCCTLGEGRGERLPSRNAAEWDQLENISVEQGRTKPPTPARLHNGHSPDKGRGRSKSLLGIKHKSFLAPQGAWATSDVSKSHRARRQDVPTLARPLWQEGRMGFFFFYLMTSVQSHSPYPRWTALRQTAASTRTQNRMWFQQNHWQEQALPQQEVRSENHGNVG